MTIRIDAEPCKPYVGWQHAAGAFFDGVEWADVLRNGLGCTSRYLWDADAKKGQLLSMFRRGPFSIGYLGFPVCADPDADADAEPYVLDAMASALQTWSGRPQLLRLPVSTFGSRVLKAPGRRRLLMETCIEDLPAWRADATAERRRYLSVARRRCSHLKSDPASGHALFALYSSAVARNRGRVRYTQTYFEQVAAVAGRELRIHSLTNEASADAAGMVITARHGDTVYYLHGGTDPTALGLGVADLLMAEAISTAQGGGARRFSFLSSPIDQPGLVRFKEKWGGATREVATIDLPMGLAGQILVRML